MHAVVIGESNLVGLPTAALLRKSGATVTICHKDTSDLSKHTSDADVLVSAVGKASLVTGDMVKPGVVAMDVGIQKGTDGQIYGDLDFPSVATKASLITPVPGGIGPI
jgi:methylenetetrahydrofolate dehydrogenase (NADP+)/methenyltetrahydrofolate cyclohydrolase